MVLRDQHVDFARLQGGEAVLGRQRHELDLVGVVEDGGGDGAADVDVEAGPFALRVGQAEAGQRAVGAAIEDAAVLHRLQGLRGGALRDEDDGKSEKAGNAFHADGLFDANSVAALLARTAKRMRHRRATAPAVEMLYVPGHFAPSPLGFRISERSGRKVKGLTLAADAAVYGRATTFAYPSTRPDLQIAMAKTPKTPLKPETRLVTAGRDTKGQHGFVNPAVYHASTVLYPTAEDQVAHRSRYQYGRRGTPTSEALEERAARARRRGLRRRRADAVGAGGDLHRAALGRRRRRPHPGHRQRLPADPQFLRRRVQAHGRARPPITIR